MREEIDQRPAMVAALGLIAGVVGRQYWEAWAVLAALLLVVRSKRAAVIAVPSLAVGLLIAPIGGRAPITERVPFAGSLEVTAVPREQASRFVTETRNELGDFLLVSAHPDGLEVGSIVSVRGTLRPMRESASPQSAFMGRVFVNESGVQVLRKSSSAAWLGGVVKKRFAEFADRSIGRERSSILQALSFNETSGIDKQFKKNLQRTGTIHIVSASGVHVMMLAGALALIMGKMPIMRHWQLLALLSVLCLYAAAAGFEPPIVRAIVMAALGFGAYLFAKEPDLLSSLSIAMIGQVLWNSASVYDIGVQLSFVTVASFGMFLSGRLGVRGPLGWLALAAKVSVVATLASAPLTAYYFGQVSISAPLANLLIAGLVSPILIVSLGSFAFSGLLPGGATEMAMAATVAPWIAALEAIVNTIGSWQYAALPVPGFSPYWLLAIYGLAIALWRPRARVP